MLLQVMVQHIEHWLVENLTPWVGNPRRHSEANTVQIAARPGGVRMKRALLWLLFAGCALAQFTPPPSNSSCSGDINSGCTQVTNLSHVTNASLPNSGLANPSVTVGGATCTLGSSCTPSAAAPSGPCLASGSNYFVGSFLDQIPGAASGATFSWVNQNGATVTTSGCAQTATQVSTTSDQWNLLCTSAPGAHFTIIAVFAVRGPSSITSYASAGPVMYETSTGKDLGFGIAPDWGNPGFVYAYGVATGGQSQGGATFAGFPSLQGSVVQAWYWSKLVYNGTSVLAYASSDGGATWDLLLTVTASSYFTTAPNQACFGVRPAGGNVTATLAGWSTTSP
jgi:hypothetical protein